MHVYTKLTCLKKYQQKQENMKNDSQTIPKSMKNRYEFHARKSDAKMVDNEHHLGPKSGENVGVLNYSVRFRCQNGTQPFIIFRNFAILFPRGVLGCPLTRFDSAFGRFWVPSGPCWHHLGPIRAVFRDLFGPAGPQDLLPYFTHS